MSVQRRDAAIRCLTAVGLGVLYFVWQELALAVVAGAGTAAFVAPRRA